MACCVSDGAAEEKSKVEIVARQIVATAAENEAKEKNDIINMQQGAIVNARKHYPANESGDIEWELLSSGTLQGIPVKNGAVVLDKQIFLNVLEALSLSKTQDAAAAKAIIDNAIARSATRQNGNGHAR